MVTKDIPPQLILPPGKFPVVRNGSIGIVYRISKEYVAKVLFEGKIFEDVSKYRLRDNGGAIGELERECEIAANLYDHEIPCPKPLGVERISLYDSSVSYPAFIMEYIPHPTGAELGFYEYEIAFRLLKETLGDAVELGFIPGDDWKNPNNFFYDRGNKKVILVDFDKWTFEDPYVQEKK